MARLTEKETLRARLTGIQMARQMVMHWDSQIEKD
jgi:hypothetical protein